MKFHHLALKEAQGKVLGLTLILGAIWLLVAGLAEAVHSANPCSARGGNYSFSWLSQLFGFFVLLLGLFIFFGSTISNKIKNFFRPRRR